jgi:hypothetical protein
MAGADVSEEFIGHAESERIDYKKDTFHANQFRQTRESF